MPNRQNFAVVVVFLSVVSLQGLALTAAAAFSLAWYY